jgi:ankyrin repeat protein
LHVACEVGFTEAVTLLLQNHANPNIQEAHYGYTPMHIAAIKG